MATRPETSSKGISLGGAVFIVFLVLKLTHVIDWSWWWVTAPLWAPIGIAVVLFAIGGVLLGAAKVLEGKEGTRK